MRIATWNVNSLRVRLAQVLDWLEATRADVLCLQETKLVDEKFPARELAEAGYESVFSGQPTYNGVAILARKASVGAPRNVVAGNPLYADEQKRLISASVAGIRVVCGYFPNGQSVESDKYRYKLEWIDQLLRWLEPQLAGAEEPVVLVGDFNIAPQERDVHDPAAWAGQVLFSDPERERFRALESIGLVDAFRLFDQPDKSYTWWDYRQMAFRRNLGLRIDHIMVAESLRERVSACAIDREMRKREQPSDHAPVFADLR